MSQRLWEGPEYRYDEADAVLGKIKKQIRWAKFEEAMRLCDHLKAMLNARKALERERV